VTGSTGVPRTLVVTNDFPPRVGGVQQYVWSLVSQLPPDRVAVLAPAWAGATEHDEAAPFPIHRWPSRFLWPTRDLARRVASLVGEHEAQVVLFGHGFPLPLLAPGLAGRGVPSVVLTHGAEWWIARTPGLGTAFRRGLAPVREVTSVSAFTGRSVRAAMPDGATLTVLYPGVDADRFSPTVSGAPIRERFGLDGRPLIVCVSRLVPRKGQDTLIRAMGDVRGRVPGAVLLVAGDGPDRERLANLALEAPPGAVIFSGEVAPEELPATYAAADVFAMPCRSRFGGLEVEGLGIVFLEAAACGIPVVAGRSGGSDEAVVDGETGELVEGTEPKAVALAIVRLLDDRRRAASMGTAGRARVESGFTWKPQGQLLAGILSRAARLGPG
jgi:phosphatidylinositol alpha-1,6-mannosyltransferase